MTRALYRIYNRLQKKQVNHRDVAIVEITEHFVTFHVAFPGLYLTYDTVGSLLATETEAERGATGKPLYEPGQQPIVRVEMGSDTRGLGSTGLDEAPPWATVDDDDVPF